MNYILKKKGKKENLYEYVISLANVYFSREIASKQIILLYVNHIWGVKSMEQHSHTKSNVMALTKNGSIHKGIGH